MVRRVKHENHTGGIYSARDRACTSVCRDGRERERASARSDVRPSAMRDDENNEKPV